MYRAGQAMKLLRPEQVSLFKEACKTEGLCLVLKGGDGNGEVSYTDVSVHQMFPLSHPHNLITFCDKRGEEIGVLLDLQALEEASRLALLDELEMAYFIPKIQRILSIKEEFGVIRWEVETDKGPRSFEVQSRHDIRPMGGGRFIVRDMDGNRYDIPDMAALDAKSRAFLELEV